MINNSDGSTSGTSSSKRDQIYPNMKQKETIFVLCDTCRWSATFFTKLMLPAENRCPQCQNTELSSFPILPNESFIWSHSEKRGI